MENDKFIELLRVFLDKEDLAMSLDEIKEKITKNMVSYMAVIWALKSSPQKVDALYDRRPKMAVLCDKDEVKRKTEDLGNMYAQLILDTVMTCTKDVLRLYLNGSQYIDLQVEIMSREMLKDAETRFFHILENT